MIIEISTYFCNLLYKEKLINDEDREIYEYGFQITIANLLNMITVIIIGFIGQLFIEAVTFLLVFASLRFFCGGYHAKTYTRCISLFSAICAAVLILTKLGMAYHLHTTVLFISVVLEGWCIYKKAPIENEHRPLNEEEKIRFRRLSWLLYGFWSAAAVCMNLLKSYHLVLAVSMTMISVSLLMLFEKNKQHSVFA